MNNPFGGLKPIDEVPTHDQWAGAIPRIEDWGDELAILDTGEPEFDTQANPEIDTRKKLAADKAYMRMPTRRMYVDFRANPDALLHLKRLPKVGQSLHGIISGKYALWDMVPALIERTGESIADLYLCTLGFSKKNGADLCGMVDDRQVRRVSLLCSHYFKATSSPIYDAVVPELLNRGQRVTAMRTHCKLILARMTDGRKFVCESSANLRSCVNVEQFVLTNCPRLYRFHRRWLEHEILTPAPKARDG
jgi:hypothetical protein